MAEGKQGSSSGKGQSSESGASGASAQEKTDKALKDERTEGKGSSEQGGQGESSSSGSSSSGEGKGSSKSGASKGSSGGSQGSSGGGDEEVQQPISEEQQAEQAQRSELNTGEDAELVRDPSGVMAPKGNAPGPERNREPEIKAVDTRPRIEPRDRATFLGAVHARDDQVQVPDDYNVFAGSDGERDAEVVELDAEPVEYFQVIGTNQELVLRIGDQAFVLDREQTRGFLSDARAVASNVVS